MSLRSRITVTDFVADDVALDTVRVPRRYSPNLHHVGDCQLHESGEYFEVTSLYGRKFGRGRGPSTPERDEVEVIPAGSRLRGQLRLFNVTAVELGGLLSALGIEPASALKLGGGKAHGLGRVRCHAEFHLAGAAPRETWRAHFTDSADYWRDGEARLVALHGEGC